MVDVGGKSTTDRTAEAEGYVSLTEAIMQALLDRTAEKGDVLTIAETAGIMGAKRTPELVPLCHNINLNSVQLHCTLDRDRRVVHISCTVAAREVTGVEMEALTGVSVAALTIYDMCKGIDKGMTIGPIRLVRKSGGKSGSYLMEERPEGAV